MFSIHQVDDDETFCDETGWCFQNSGVVCLMNLCDETGWVLSKFRGGLLCTTSAPSLSPPPLHPFPTPPSAALPPRSLLIMQGFPLQCRSCPQYKPPPLFNHARTRCRVRAVSILCSITCRSRRRWWWRRRRSGARARAGGGEFIDKQ